MNRYKWLLFKLLLVLLIPQYTQAQTPASIEGFVELGDITGDGKVDAVIAKNTYSIIGVMEGDGVGGFGGSGILETYDAINEVTYIQLMDSYSTDNYTNLLIGTSIAELKIAPIAQNVPRMSTSNTFNITPPYNFLYRDINNDGFADKINQSGSALEVSLGIDGLNFSAPKLIASNSYTPLDAADINGDGFMDLLLQASSNNIAIYYGNGSGGFTPAANLLTGVALQFTHLNDDGLWDIVSIYTDSSGGKNFEFLLGSSTQFFPSRIQTNLPYFDTDSAMADLNQDGFSDLVQVATGANSLYVFHGDGSGNFSGHVEYAFLDVEKAVEKVVKKSEGEGSGCLVQSFSALHLSILVFIALVSIKRRK